MWCTLFAAALALRATAALAAAPAQVPDGPGIWSLNLENSSVSLGQLPDRNYTNGIGLGWTSAAGEVPAAISALGAALYGPGEDRISLGVFQQIFTPDDTRANPPSP
ncbi:MAG: lipid A-modifier LpxR family protein [Acetobacteraceae bacterium]